MNIVNNEQKAEDEHKREISRVIFLKVSDPSNERKRETETERKRDEGLFNGDEKRENKTPNSRRVVVFCPSEMSPPNVRNEALSSSLPPFRA